MQITSKDVYGEDGNMIRIETYELNGDHLYDFVWDDRDEHTEEKRIEFRKFVKRMLHQKGYDFE